MATLTATKPAIPRTVLAPVTVALMGDPVSRRRVTSAIDESEFEVVATGSSLGTLLDTGPDLAILIGDTELLGRGGAIETLRKLRPDCTLVIVAQSQDRSLIRKALRAGVDGFVHQADIERALPHTLDAVLAGQISVPQAIREQVSWTSLSIREKQVLQLVAAGLTNSEVASRLFLSESTVKSHLSSSFRKLGVSSRAEAAALILDPDNGLRVPEPDARIFSLERELLGHSTA